MQHYQTVSSATGRQSFNMRARIYKRTSIILKLIHVHCRKGIEYCIICEIVGVRLITASIHIPSLHFLPTYFFIGEVVHFAIYSMHPDLSAIHYYLAAPVLSFVNLSCKLWMRISNRPASIMGRPSMVPPGTTAMGLSGV